MSSVQTTSTKPPNVIKADLRRVLDRMQIQYRENKTGFECIHLPSIDLNSVDPARNGHHQSASGNSNDNGATPVYHRPSIVKKASKLSFGMKKERREPSIDREGRDKESVVSRPSLGTTTLGATPSCGSSSFFNVALPQTGDSTLHPNGISSATFQPQHNGVGSDDDKDKDREPGSRSNSPTISNRAAKVLPPIPRDFGATSPTPRSVSPLPTAAIDKEVFESMGRNSLSVRFDINIVKVSFFDLVSFVKDADESLIDLGSLAPPPWTAVPPCWWRWLAIPDAGETSAD